jgi:hypothetical protein
MSDWISQFTSSYFSAIAYGLTVLFLTLLLKPAYNWISRWSQRLQKETQVKREKNLLIPTEREVNTFSKKQTATDNEWKDSIEFLKNDVSNKLNPQIQKPLFSKTIFLHVDKYSKIYQYTLWGFAIFSFLFFLFQIHIWQSLFFILSMVLFCWMMILFIGYSLSIAIENKQENARFVNLKSHIREAINVIAPGISFTYKSLGECLKEAREQDLPILQSELAEMGMKLKLKDMKLAYFLSKASKDELLSIGESIIPKEQLENLSEEEKKEGAQLFIDVFLLSSVSLNE